MPQVKPDIETFAKIKVVGVGGSGGSAVDRMVRSGIRGVEFWVMNTDVQALHHNSAPHKLHIGKTVTRGLGAGMDPEMGKRAAEEAQNDVREALKDADMVFVTCGLGGGTGSGAAPVIAAIARDLGILTVAVVTKPFTFEGPQRKAIADHAHDELARHVDAIITIPNDRILQIVDKKTSLLEAFKIVDDVLHQGVQGISETITVPGLINVDFADVKTIMRDTGSALMGIGKASGENRAADAAKAAISSPLLDLSIDGARGILFTITGGTNLGMHEVSEAAKIITGSTDDNARVIFGAVIDETMGDEVRITVIATGFEDRERSYAHEVERDRDLVSMVKKPVYSSSLFTKKKFVKPEPTIEEDDSEIEQIPQPRVGFSTKPLTVEAIPLQPSQVQSPQQIPQQPIQSGVQQKPKPANEDEDLEIPAFIRKKMGM
jgi:cell division protein FtsZ